jgi:hypothetical protein
MIHGHRLSYLQLRAVSHCSPDDEHNFNGYTIPRNVRLPPKAQHRTPS